MHHLIRLIFVLTAVCTAWKSIDAQAANTWDGGGSTDNWSEGTNWDDNQLPSFPAALTFTGSTRLTPNNDLSSLTLNGISFTSPAGTFTLGGNAVTLSGNITNTSGQTQKVNIPLALGSDVTITGSSQTQMKQAISGTGSVTLTGTGAVSFDAQNSYSGDTIVNISGGSNFISSVAQPNIHGLIFENTSGGSGPNASFQGSVTATSMSVQNQISSSLISLGAFNTLTVNGGVSIGTDPANSSTNSKVTIFGGTNFVINAGSDNLAVGANSTGTGSTVAQLKTTATGLSFSGAEVRIGGSQADNTGNGANGELDLSSSSSLTADSLTVGGGSNQAAGTGLLRLGTTNVVHSDTIYVGTQQSSGTINYNSLGIGSLVIRNRAGTGRAAIVIGNQNLNTSNTISTSGIISLSGSSTQTEDILASSLTIGKSSSTTSHGGTVGGTANFGNPGTIDVTTIQMASNGVNGVATQGNLTIGQSSGSLQGTMLIVNSASGPGGGSFTLASNSSNGGSAAGTFTITNGGTAQVNTDILLGATNGEVSGTVTLTGGFQQSTLDMLGHQIGTAAANINLVAIDGTLKNLAELNGGGTLTKTGSGLATLVIAGTNTYTGATSVSAGTLLLNGTHTGGGTYSVASGAVFGGAGSTTSAVVANPTALVTPGTVNTGTSIGSLGMGSLDLEGGVRIDLNDADPNVVDLLNVAGALDLDPSTSAISFHVNGTLSQPVYVFASYSSLDGQFGSATAPSGYAIDYHYNDGTDSNNIALVAVPEPSTLLLGAIGFAGWIAAARRRRV